MHSWGNCKIKNESYIGLVYITAWSLNLDGRKHMIGWKCSIKFAQDVIMTEWKGESSPSTFTKCLMFFVVWRRQRFAPRGSHLSRWAGQDFCLLGEKAVAIKNRKINKRRTMGGSSKPKPCSHGVPPIAPDEKEQYSDGLKDLLKRITQYLEKGS